MVEIERLVLDVGQAIRLQALLQRTLAPMVESRVVDHEHLALRPHDIACQLAVVAVAGEHISDAHSGLDAGKTQNVGRVDQCVAL
jgi:hypothetical protein